MKFIANVLILATLLHTALLLLCYNGTFDHRDYGGDPIRDSGLFIPTSKALTRIRCSLTLICPDNAMCFVRSWSARAYHAWVVQRGCYQALVDDSLQRTLTLPTRSMTCKRERLPDAEYQVCLCKSDWCNTAYYIKPYKSKYLQRIAQVMLFFIFIFIAL